MKRKYTPATDEQILELLEKQNAGKSFEDACLDIGVETGSPAVGELQLFWNDGLRMSILNSSVVPDKEFVTKLMGTLSGINELPALHPSETESLPWMRNPVRSQEKSNSFFELVTFLNWKIAMPAFFIVLMVGVGLSQALGGRDGSMGSEKIAIGGLTPASGGIEENIDSMSMDTSRVSDVNPVMSLAMSTSESESGNTSSRSMVAPDSMAMKSFAPTAPSGPLDKIMFTLAQESINEEAVLMDAGNDIIILVQEDQASLLLNQSYETNL